MKKGVLAGGLLLGLGLLALLMARIIPLPERLSAPPSSMVLFEDGRRAHLALAPDDRWRVAVSLDEIDPAYLKALLHLEDKRFWYHPGVDPVAIARAVVSNITQGRVVSGASTLTMQLVRMVERRPRTLRSKAIEALRALQLEVHFSKAEILEKYLQFLPFGKNVEGIEAASLAYFSHRANALSSHEIALLLAVPQAPTARHPSVQNQGRLLKARNEILEDLVAGGVFLKGEAELEAAKAQAIPQSMAHFPRDLPHGAQWFFAERGQSTPRIHTTLDGDIQKSAVEQLRRHQKRLNRGGIYNGSVVVVDHQSMEIKALVGNFDFWDEKNGGQINGFATARSVGSTMKPFIYALAIDERLALPDHLLPDIPLSYGAYQPENYDGQYAGLVRLDDALSRSLNLPFIELLRRLKVEVFLGKLQEMGAQTLVKKPGYYGLSLAAGALALSPIEVATFYAVLARGGAYKSLRIYRDSPWEPELRIFSAGAAELTRRALSLRDRPDFPIRSHIGGKIPGIHWKTGTSFGHRDAWSVGSNGRYTVAVWLGNLIIGEPGSWWDPKRLGPSFLIFWNPCPGGPACVKMKPCVRWKFAPIPGVYRPRLARGWCNPGRRSRGCPSSAVPIIFAWISTMKRAWPSPLYVEGDATTMRKPLWFCLPPSAAGCVRKA